jgi:hypothetical protein
MLAEHFVGAANGETVGAKTVEGRRGEMPKETAKR